MACLVIVRAVCLSESMLNRKSRKVIKESIGTFIDVAGKTMVLTCYHGVDNMIDVVYQIDDKEYVTSMAKSIPEYDIALLNYYGPNIKGLSLKTNVFDSCNLEVYSILFGNKIEIDCEQKWKWACRKHNSTLYPESMFIDVDNSVFEKYEEDISGMSGSPIISNGYIVGIMSYSHGATVSFTHSSVIKMMIDNKPIKVFPIVTRNIYVNGYEGLVVIDAAKVELEVNKKTFKFATDDIIMKVNDSVIENGNVWCDELDAYVLISTCAMSMDKIKLTIIRNREVVDVVVSPVDILQFDIMPYLPTKKYWTIGGFVFTDMSEELIAEYSALHKLTNNTDDTPFYTKGKSICLIDIDRSALDDKILNKVDKLGLPLIEKNNEFTIPIVSKIDKTRVDKIKDAISMECSKIVLKGSNNISIRVEDGKIVSLS